MERAAALVIGGGGGVRAACQHPAHEVLPAGVDGLVEGDVAAAVPQPQALRVAPVQDFERGQLALGRAAMRSTKTEKLTLIFGSIRVQYHKCIIHNMRRESETYNGSKFQKAYVR